MAAKSILESDLVREADKFIHEWDENEIELSDVADKYVFGKERGISGMFEKKIDVPNRLATTISEYKRARHFATLPKTGDVALDIQIDFNNDRALRAWAENLISIKTKLEAIKMFRPGKGHRKKLRELREQLTKANNEKEKWEHRAREAERGEQEAKKNEEKIAGSYDALDKMFTSLTNKIKHDMGETGERYIADALTFDPTIIESDVEDASEDDNHV